MRTVTSSDFPELASYGARIRRRRARDAYFDGLCVAYHDVENQLAAARRKDGQSSHGKIAQLEKQRLSFLNTILFLLDDHDGMTRHAA